MVVGNLDMMLSNKRITKALIRLSECAGWSAPLLFANIPKTGFLAQLLNAMRKRFVHYYANKGEVPRMGGGGTLIFSYIRRLGSFFGVYNFEFQYFLAFSEK